MSVISSNSAVLIVEELQTKFDTGVVSNSLIRLLDSYLEARIVQQLHYWTVKEYGKVINGCRWIYKPIREWLSEAIVGFTSWQLRKAIASLVEKGILFRKHLFKEHHGNNFSPKNRTYYYSLNYEGLEEYAEKQKSAESTENVRFVSPTKQFCESSEKQFCDMTKNKTDLTSIENNSINQSHPHLPCVGKVEKKNSQEQNLSNLKVLQDKENNSFDSTVTESDTNDGRVEEKINKNNCTNNDAVQVEVEKPKLKKTPKGTKPKRRGQAPWKDEGQFKRFYRALIQTLPIVANARSPQGLAQTIIRQLRTGIPHSYWDDFAAGLPIGTLDKPEWEVEPGVPYPQFIEYLTEKIIKGNNTQTNEQARNEVFRILEKPRQAKAFWGQFKRSVVNVSKQVERDRALGVSNPNTPVWTRERIEPSIEEAAAAGQKIMAVNGATQAVIESSRNSQLEAKSEPSTSDPWIEESKPDAQRSGAYPQVYPLGNPLGQLSMREMLAERGVKGFCKPMPKVSQAELEAQERKQKKPKTNIAQMSLAEINEYLTDPILRAQLAPQLFDSDYELITDELGQIIRIKLSEAQIREKQLQKLEE